MLKCDRTSEESMKSHGNVFANRNGDLEDQKFRKSRTKIFNLNLNSNALFKKK